MDLPAAAPAARARGSLISSRVLSSSSTVYFPTYKPEVTITGIATHPEADPEPVLIVDGPFAYQVRIKADMLGFGRTADKKGMQIDGTVDVSEGRLETASFVRREGMRRLYPVGDFSFTFAFTTMVKKAVIKGRSRRDGSIKFIVPKKQDYEPDSDTDPEFEFEYIMPPRQWYH